jgi:hypothetical protein
MTGESSAANRSWWQCMLETPAGSPSALSRHTLWNGVLYLAVGAALYLAPDLVRKLLSPFQHCCYRFTSLASWNRARSLHSRCSIHSWRSAPT